MGSHSRQDHSLQWRVDTDFLSKTKDMQAIGIAGPLVGLHNDVLMVGGGANFSNGMPWQGGKKFYYSTIYAFQKEEHRQSLQLIKSFNLPKNSAYSANCSTPYGVVCAGGENENGAMDEVWNIQWDKEQKKMVIKHLPKLPIPLTNPAITYSHNTVFVAGGETIEGVSKSFFSLSLDGAGTIWNTLLPIPQPTSHAVLLSANGFIYLIGGRKKSPSGVSKIYSTLFQYNIDKNSWRKMQSMPYPLSAGTGIAFGHELFMFGGDRGNTLNKVEQLMADIQTEKNMEKKKNLTTIKNNLLQHHPGFSREILVYNTALGKWSIRSPIPFEVPVTTTAVSWKNVVLIPSGEIRAGVRSPNLLVGNLVQPKIYE